MSPICKTRTDHNGSQTVSGTETNLTPDKLGRGGADPDALISGPYNYVKYLKSSRTPDASSASMAGVKSSSRSVAVGGDDDGAVVYLWTAACVDGVRVVTWDSFGFVFCRRSRPVLAR